jgi:hypothetical protein
MALDMLGLTDGSMGDWTQAIADFEQEGALDPRRRFRVQSRLPLPQREVRSGHFGFEPGDPNSLFRADSAFAHVFK